MVLRLTTSDISALGDGQASFRRVASTLRCEDNLHRPTSGEAGKQGRSPAPGCGNTHPIAKPNEHFNMNDQSSSSRKFIVAIAMAVVVAIGTVTFALRSHHPTAVAQIPAVPASVPQTPDAATSSSQTQDVPGVVPQTPDVPTSAAQRDRLAYSAGASDVPAAVEPKSAADRPVAKAHTRVGTSNRSVTRTDSAVVASEKPAVATVAGSMDGGTSVDVPTTPSAPSGMAANAPEVAMSTDPAASSSAPVASNTETATGDIRITTAVKSEIAADSNGKDANVGVTTTNGVVVLTGTMATQDAIDHVKGVAEKVKDVKSVDTSALKITST
jgi:hyperosmotically inducible periplasmic protein